jgi:hypothetical protein
MHTIVIESDHAYARIEELAAREGKSVAAVVVDAVEEKLERVPTTTRGDLAERLIAMSAETSRLWTDRTPHGDLLYDDDGLPT